MYAAKGWVLTGLFAETLTFSFPFEARVDGCWMERCLSWCHRCIRGGDHAKIVSHEFLSAHLIFPRPEIRKFLDHFGFFILARSR
jgi:hypothetical protein